MSVDLSIDWSSPTHPRYVNQDRWNRIGSGIAADLLRAPKKYMVDGFPYPGPNHDMYDHLLALLSPLEGKRIIEFGCGFGNVSVWLAKHGARVTGVDLGPNLIQAAQAIARINEVECEFLQRDVTVGPPAESSSFDVVLGLAVLHHLSAEDLRLAVQTASLLLKPNGVAIFCEPVENSRIFGHLQNLFPVGKKGSTRPSILQRKAWRNYKVALDDRDLSTHELMRAGKPNFRFAHVAAFGFLIRLEGLLGPSYRQTLWRADRILFRVFPPIKRYCQNVLVEYRK